MHKSKLLLPSSIFGFIILAIIISFTKWDFSNIGPVKRIFYASNGKPVYFWELTNQSIK